MPAQLTKIGKYDVLEVIGRGGMGVVYKATDPYIGRFVAIKMITAGFAGNPDLLKRFYREAQSTGNLQNPNIVTVYDLGDHDGNPYLVMEYLEGRSLESIIAGRSSLALTEKLGIIIDVCNGLSYAHQRGVVHRDIKPANIMVLNDGVAKIVDFGIARIGDSRMTRTDQVIGSIHYMSSEQLHNQQLDSRTDIYSAGVVLFQLLTLALPFDAAETAATLLKIVNDPPPPLSAYIKDYPPELEGVVARALAKNRDERYASAKDLAFDLLRIQEQVKDSAVAQFFGRAKEAIQRSEWGNAKELLQQVLRIDRQHMQAHQFLRKVQERIEKQQKSEQARRLQTSADEAFSERRFDDALALLDQAIGLDSANVDLQSFRESVRTAKARASKLEQAVRRAEAAQVEGDFQNASQAVAEALSLDPNNTQAKALQVIIGRQIQERARQEQLRSLLDKAKAEISGCRLTDAFEALKKAEALDPTSVEMKALLKLAVVAREQEVQKADLEKLNQEIREALGRDDYVEASAKAAAGLERYPRERELIKLQALAEAQRQRVAQKIFLREQLAAASSLLDSGKLLEALATLERVSQRVPENAEIASLRSLVKDRLSRAEAEEHKSRSLQQACDMIAARNYANAVRALEKAQQEFPRSTEIDQLLGIARAEHAKQRAVSEASIFATQLIERGELERAAELLESTLRDLPDQQLRDLLAHVRSQLEQFEHSVQSALGEGQRILREHGASEAAKFLDAQPLPYFAVPRLREFQQTVKKQQVVEDLERELGRESSLDRQIAIADEVLRKNPGNVGVESKFLAAREKRNLIQRMVNQAHELERSREYAQAIETWNNLREIWPQYPQLDAEVSRLEKLEQQKKSLASKKASAKEIPPAPPAFPEPPAPSSIDHPHEVAATTMLEDLREPQEPSPIAEPSQKNALGVDSRLGEASLEVSLVAPDTRRGRRIKIVVLACSAALLLAAVFSIIYSTRQVSVHIETDPSGSQVTIRSSICISPCNLRLPPGTYMVQARHDAYETLAQEVSIARGAVVPILKLRPTVDAGLTPQTPSIIGTLSVQANLEGVNVFVDGALKGITGRDYRLTIPVDQGNHEIRVQKPGYQEAPAQAVRIVANTESVASFNLERPSISAPAVPTISYLTINGLPGADISVDQRSVGLVARDGTLSLQVSPGEHRLDAHLEGYETWSKREVFKAGERVRVDAEMHPGATIAPKTAAPTASASMPVAKLTATPGTIELGQPATLNWQTKDASAVTIEGIGSVPLNGYRQVTPSESTIYRLTASGSGGTATASFQVSVLAPSTVNPRDESEGDRKAIAAILEQYRQAYDSRDRVQLRHIWPTMSDKQFKDLQGAFKDADSLTLSLRQSGPANVQGNTATVSCLQDTQIKAQGKIQMLTNNATFYFKRLGKDWIIERIDYGKAP